VSFPSLRSRGEGSKGAAGWLTMIQLEAGDGRVDVPGIRWCCESRLRLTTSYYVYVCRRGSFTNFSHGGPLDVCSFYNPHKSSLRLAGMGRSDRGSQRSGLEISDITPKMTILVIIGKSMKL